MIHVSSFIKSLKVTWIRKLLGQSKSPAWKNIVLETVLHKACDISSMGDHYFKLLAKKTTNCFWKDVFASASELLKIVSQKVDHESFLRLPIWQNSQLQIGGSPIFNTAWFNRGIRFICDLFDQSGKFLSFEDLSRKFNFRPMITLYYGLRQCINSVFNIDSFTNLHTCFPMIPLLVQTVTRDKSGTKNIYAYFISEMYQKPGALSKWDAELDVVKTEAEWQEVLLNSVICTDDIQLRWFQMRITHRIITTNTFLCRIGVLDANLCSFCQSEPERIVHLFCSCPVVRDFWSDITRLISGSIGVVVNMDFSTIIFGNLGKENEAINIIILLAKKHIYNRKLNHQLPSIVFFKKQLHAYYSIERFRHRCGGRTEVFNNRWAAWADIFNEPARPV